MCSNDQMRVCMPDRLPEVANAILVLIKNLLVN